MAASCAAATMALPHSVLFPPLDAVAALVATTQGSGDADVGIGSSNRGGRALQIHRGRALREPGRSGGPCAVLCDEELPCDGRGSLLIWK